MPTKINLAKNKLRSMGLKMSYDMEGDVVEESDKKREERIKTRNIAAKLTQDLPLDHPAFGKSKNDLRPTPGLDAMADVRARIAAREKNKKK